MAVDFSVLRQNDFWKRKSRRALQVRDTDKDGYISRADYELYLDRYKKLTISTPSNVERVAHLVRKVCDSYGLVDESVKLSYDEFEEKWIAANTKDTKFANKAFAGMFHLLDTDGSGFISLEEWTAHYEWIGIDTAHAPASFDAIDTDHDGKISEDEFVKYHIEYYLSTENKLNSAILYGPWE